MDPDRCLATPCEMIAHLDTIVAGQKRAKEDVAVAFYRHYMCRAMAAAGLEDQLPSRGHLLLMGPTGAGKTLLVRSVCEFLDIPCSYMSATSLVQTGYVGTTIEGLFESLYNRCGRHRERAEQAVLFIDEIDKIRSSGGIGPDVSGEGVQNALLTAMDGRLVTLGREASNGEMDTSGVLFVCAGAFAGLRDVVGRRLSAERGRLWDPGRDPLTDDDAYALAQSEDLVAYGLIPEFVGRFATIASVRSLDRADLLAILNESSFSPIEKQRRYYATHGVDLVFTDGAREAIAEECVQLGIGARGLERMVRLCLAQVEPQMPDLAQRGVHQVVVNELTVRGFLMPNLLPGDPEKLAQGNRAEQIRQTALSVPAGSSTAPAGRISNTAGWSSARFHQHLSDLKRKLAFDDTTGSARKWWEKFEAENAHRLGLVVRLAEELSNRNATITEFFLAYVYSSCDNIQANLHYLDYTRLKKDEERKRREQQLNAANQADTPPLSSVPGPNPHHLYREEEEEEEDEAEDELEDEDETCDDADDEEDISDEYDPFDPEEDDVVALPEAVSEPQSEEMTVEAPAPPPVSPPSSEATADPSPAPKSKEESGH